MVSVDMLWVLFMLFKESKLLVHCKLISICVFIYPTDHLVKPQHHYLYNSVYEIFFLVFIEGQFGLSFPVFSCEADLSR